MDGHKHHSRFVDLSGKRFGMVIADSYVGYNASCTLWSFRCDCGTTFTASGAYISKASNPSCGCLRKSRLVTKTCENCGQNFSQTPGKIRRKSFCSMPCYREKAKGRPRKTRVNAKKEFSCPSCGTLFSILDSQIGKKKFCSRPCARQGNRKSIRKTCPCCKEEFMSPPSKEAMGHGIYCSLDCFRVHRADVTFLVKARGECNRCHWNEEQGILAIHHIDRNRQNNAPENLELLCPRCHTLDHFRAGDGPFHKQPMCAKSIAESVADLAEAIKRVNLKIASAANKRLLLEASDLPPGVT